MNALARLRVILSTLRRHKVAVALLVLEIALTMAVLANMLFILQGSMKLADERTGVMERDLGIIQSIGVVGEGNWRTTAGNIDLLDRVPGVVAASFGGVPGGGGDGALALYTGHNMLHKLAEPYTFSGVQGYVKTLGVRIVAGHAPTPEELPDQSTITATTIFPALMTQALARRLFPHGGALGKVLYSMDQGGMRVRIVGLMARLRGVLTGRASDSDSILVQYRLVGAKEGGIYLVRSQPGQLHRVLPLAAKALQRANPANVTSAVITMRQALAMQFRGAKAVDRMLMAIMTILLVVTALGVSGLASYWVQQRARHIGTRRALGATRGSILRYFQTENFLIVSIGVVLGAGLTLALNEFLMRHFELARLPAAYIGVAALALWLLGQLAVLGPALRAARVPPTMAMRAA
ncbi:MAG: ABC transporter permease [Metallibacterium scheffleri]|jgi:putative ABC transport system permease protein